VVSRRAHRGRRGWQVPRGRFELARSRYDHATGWRRSRNEVSSSQIEYLRSTGVPVAIGAVQNESRPFLHYYIDRNSYRRTGDTISFDLVMQMTIQHWSRLHANVTVDCAVRTFLMPTFQTFEGPLATGGPKTKEKSYMKKPKVYGDLKAEDLAYFCEGASPAPIS